MTDDKVITLTGKPFERDDEKKSEPKPNPDFVAFLERLLEEAKRGELKGLATIANYGEATLKKTLAGEAVPQVNVFLGELEIFRFAILQIAAGAGA